MNSYSFRLIFFLFLFLTDFLISQTQKPIIVIVPSYNNIKWCKLNLKSIFDQQYDNYLVIYINDCSTDYTFLKVKKIIKMLDQKHHTILINNHERCGALSNLYNAIMACDKHAIIVTVDGDDWLSHPRVLERINAEYNEKNIWITYGQYKEYPSGGIGFSRAFTDDEIQFNLFRNTHDWLPVSHLRTFYAGLFHLINIEDLQNDGLFYTMAWDKAMMAPMLEMAGERHAFISDVLYIYNNVNPINDHRVNHTLQMITCREVLAKSKYQKISDNAFFIEEDNNVYHCCSLAKIRTNFSQADIIC